MMTKSAIEQYRKKLESSRESALRFLGRLGNEARSVDADLPQDSGDYSVSTLSKEFLMQQGSERRRLVRNIDAALQRIREGSFGICAGCEEEISPRRLNAVPWTEFCINCQEMREREKESAVSAVAERG
jgi:DnaK suppressor protein